MTPDVAPHNEEAEQAVLGAVLITSAIVPKLVTDHGLRPDHFYRPAHRHIYAAAVAVSDAGGTPDPVAVCDELERRKQLVEQGQPSRAYVHSLQETVTSIAAYGQHAGIVLEHAQLRRLRDGAHRILQGVDARDYATIGEGEQMLVRAEGVEDRTATPHELAEELWGHLEGGDPETFRFPFPRLNKLTAGGMRRGQLGLVAGWSSHGKSVIIDQFLESSARDGLRVHLFINEMSRLERTQRTAARLAQVDFEKVMLNNLDSEERKKVAAVLNRIPFGITDCAGWTAQDVTREVKRNRYDVVGIDILNRFPKANERKDLEEISRVLNELTKPSQGNCYILLGAHLNRNRAGLGLALPFPSLADLRETGMLVNDADHTFFVFREQDEETGEPMANGIVRLAKGRSCRLGGLPVRFKGATMEFEPAVSEAVKRAA